uniref:Uncharacterized protein n=1 Tax=Hyaloperonospora arabidopsidis (strain Emoy2) TaxID=559515 RepID=M4C288_HYAAE
MWLMLERGWKPFFHLNCFTTSIVEPVHSYLKSFLRSSIGNLPTVFESLHFAIEHQEVKLNNLHVNGHVK